MSSNRKPSEMVCQVLWGVNLHAAIPAAERENASQECFARPAHNPNRPLSA